MKKIYLSYYAAAYYLSSCNHQPPIDHDAYLKEMDQWHSRTA